MAPLGLTTRGLLERSVAAVGICELPALTRERLDAGAPGPLRDVGYAGLNHAGWFVPYDTADGVATTALRDRGLAAGIVDPVTWDRFGGVPVSYHYRVLDPGRGAALGIRQPPGRAQQLQRGGEAIVDALRRGEAPPASDRPTPWFDRALVPVLAAHLGGTPYRGAVNLTNGSRLPEVPPDVVVEVEATVQRCATRIEPSPPRPPAVAELLAALGDVEERLHHACVSRDVRQLRGALDALPNELRPRTGDLDAAVADIVGGEAIGS
jgi:alpha-galactosidase/6-phospho-beta-glucosidase family protein